MQQEACAQYEHHMKTSSDILQIRLMPAVSVGNINAGDEWYNTARHNARGARATGSR